MTARLVNAAARCCSLFPVPTNSPPRAGSRRGAESPRVSFAVDLRRRHHLAGRSLGGSGLATDTSAPSPTGEAGPVDPRGGFHKTGDEIRGIEAAGADRVHVDVMDGHFVPNISFGPLVCKAARKVTKLPLECHLMIAEPDRYLEAFVEAGADSILVHAEGAANLHRTLQTIRSLGKPCGVVINPATPASVLDEVLDDVDLVLVMTVNPASAGSRSSPGHCPKSAAFANGWTSRRATSNWKSTVVSMRRRPRWWSTPVRMCWWRVPQCSARATALRRRWNGSSRRGRFRRQAESGRFDSAFGFLRGLHRVAEEDHKHDQHRQRSPRGPGPD